ncbi:heme o synthase [Solitalea koreensis]|uniref:Protoheme IX farnesyltransferase n=1 Tax=Solitalea koreensis TaxID=543615 RepID=A0A521AWH3_9SPHI|nr:heme o synthase [Solitalea koreensis]SMO38920.1 protoheme IX farnesyltransferase [Solitalea koreensis]
MLIEKTVKADLSTIVSAKLADYVQLVKMRLSLLVVFSAAISYMYASRGTEYINWSALVSLIIGGFLVTGSANTFNQVLERNLDKLMSRTQDRPLPSGRMNILEASIAGLIMGIVGILFLGYGVNYLTAFFGLFSLLSYSFVYTPLKQVTRLSVFIGAIPGAMPPLLGYVAFANHFGMEPGLLFAIQFMWQFPHFWAIAWVLEEDYSKAGFHLLPASSGRSKSSATWILVSNILLIPVSILPVYYNMAGNAYLIVTLILGVLFLYQAIRLYRLNDVKSALQLMFGSFLYLPIVQIMILINKL